MPPRAAAGGKAAGGKGGGGARRGAAGGGVSSADILKANDVLQAVLLADSFQSSFRPLTLDRPKVLLPMLNVPLLDYAMEVLVSGGVGEVVIFACSHADQLQRYLSDPLSGGRGRRRKGVTIRVVVGNEADCSSFGDALRHIDTLDIIKGDFVLMSGDVVSNVKLSRALAEHKARVAADKRNFMTMLLKQTSPEHRTRPLQDDAVMAIDARTNQLLLYDNDRTETKVCLEKTLLAELPSGGVGAGAGGSVSLRYDLMDSQILICTPEVLMLFTDNFDWQTFHGDFLPGVLGSEILGNKIHVSILSRDEYAARVEDLRAYDAVSKDVIHRWTYPMVPDNNLIGADNSYRYHRGNRYRESNVIVSRQAVIGEETLIGSGCNIGDRASIQRSVLGRGCSVGVGARISGSYIWSNCTIESGAIIDRALLAEGVTIRAGARIGRGAILGCGVVIGPNFIVKPYTHITTAATEDGDDDDEGAGNKNDASAWLESEVGVGGVGRIYTGEADEDEDEEDDGDGSARSILRSNKLNSIAPSGRALRAWRSARGDDESSGDEWDFDDEDAALDGLDGPSAALDPSLANQLNPSSASGAAAAASFPFHKFAIEVAETLRRGHEEKLPIDDVRLEMSGLKFSHNATVEEFAHATCLALFAIVHEQVATASQTPNASVHSVVLNPAKDKNVMQKLGLVWKGWYPILSKFAERVSDQVEIIQGLEASCLGAGFVNVTGSSGAHAGSVAATGGLSPQTGSNAASTSSSVGSNASIYTPLFTPTLQLLYDRFNVLSEDAILQWADALKESAPEGDEHILLKQSHQFREWLEEAEEEEDEDEEDEDEDEE